MLVPEYDTDGETWVTCYGFEQIHAFMTVMTVRDEVVVAIMRIPKVGTWFREPRQPACEHGVITTQIAYHVDST